MSFEQITVAGNIGSVEPFKARTGAVYIKITLAANKGKGAAHKTTWYNVYLFGDLASDVEMVKRYYTPGRVICATGRPQTGAFIKKDGTAGLDNGIVAAALPSFLDSKPTENNAHGTENIPAASRA